MTTKEDFRAFGYDTPEFSLLGTKCYARCVNVYDGDSPTIVIPLGAKMYKFHTRLFGIDTSEMHSKDPVNKTRAVRGRNRLIELITKAGNNGGASVVTKKDIKDLLGADVYLVWVECMEMDKYGRILLKMYSAENDTKSFSDILLEEKLAYSYMGQTKLTEAQQAGM